MDYVTQARTLKRRTQRALAAMNRDGKEGLTEDEVLFRLNAIEGMLIMALNDIGRMVRRWEIVESRFSGYSLSCRQRIKDL